MSLDTSGLGPSSSSSASGISKRGKGSNFTVLLDPAREALPVRAAAAE
jgi:hypothetical protein